MTPAEFVETLDTYAMRGAFESVGDDRGLPALHIDRLKAVAGYAIEQWQAANAPATSTPAEPSVVYGCLNEKAVHYANSMDVAEKKPICGVPRATHMTSSSSSVSCRACLRMRPLSVSPPYVDPVEPSGAGVTDADVRACLDASAPWLDGQYTERHLRDTRAGLEAVMARRTAPATAVPLSLDREAMGRRAREAYHEDTGGSRRSWEHDLPNHSREAWMRTGERLAREVAEACFAEVVRQGDYEVQMPIVAEARKSLRLPAPVDHGTAREDLTAALGKQNLEVARLTADLAAAHKSAAICSRIIADIATAIGHAEGEECVVDKAREVVADLNAATHRADGYRDANDKACANLAAATKRAEEAEAALTAVLAALPVGGVGSAATQVAAVVRDRDASRHNLNLLDEMRRDYIRSAPIPPEVRALVEACLALQDFVPMAHPTDESDAEEFALRGAMFDALPAAEAALAPPAAEAVEVPCPAGEHVLEEWEQGDPLPAWIGTDDKALRRKALAWCVRQLQRLAGSGGAR